MELGELWKVKDIATLFEEKINPFITNILLLLGLEYHKENIKKYNFDNEQIKIQKQRIRECLLNDIVNKHYKMESGNFTNVMGNVFYKCKINRMWKTAI